jgi:uncharacterized membrane protein YesL
MGVVVGIVAGIVAGMVGGVMLKHVYDKHLQEPPLRRMIKSGYRKAFKRSSGWHIQYFTKNLFLLFSYHLFTSDTLPLT